MQLIAERTKLTAARRRPILKARMAKLRNRSALKIQSVVRGYLARMRRSRAEKPPVPQDQD
jgi:hypothetical protein